MFLVDFPPCCKPDGRIANSCAANLYRERVEGFKQLTGAWTGWKIQGNKLIGPNGLRFTPQTLTNAWASLSEPITPGTTPGLLVQRQNAVRRSLPNDKPTDAPLVIA